jgi:hypothetical protein
MIGLSLLGGMIYDGLNQEMEASSSCNDPTAHPHGDC